MRVILHEVFDRGYFTVARIRGASVRLHWTIPLGALFFSGFRFAPGFWVGFFLLVLLHELGHAVLVWRGGLRVVAIDVHGLGGLCRYEGMSTERWRSVIAWGGVAAQTLVLVVTLVATHLLPAPRDAFTAELTGVFLWTNVWLILFNLVPIPPLDGAEAWKLVRMPRAPRRPSSRPLASFRAPSKSRGRRDGDDVIISEAEAERIAREALTQAAEEAARKRREGQIH